MAEKLKDEDTSFGHKPIISAGALMSKNIKIHNRRTSVRLEPEMWSALHEIAVIEKCSIHDLCGAVHDLKEVKTSFTAALRVFLMEYYRAAAKTSHQISMIQRRLKGEKVANTETPGDQEATA